MGYIYVLYFKLSMYTCYKTRVSSNIVVVRVTLSPCIIMVALSTSWQHACQNLFVQPKLSRLVHAIACMHVSRVETYYSFIL